MFPSLGAKDRDFAGQGLSLSLSLASGNGTTGDRGNEVGRMRQIREKIVLSTDGCSVKSYKMIVKLNPCGVSQVEFI